MSKVKEGSYRYGVANIAKDLDLVPASVRVRLRNRKIKKNDDGTYGWNSQAEYKAVLAKLEESKPAPASKKKAVKKAKVKKKPAATTE